MIPSTVVAIFTPEELELEALILDEMTRRAVAGTWAEPRLPPTWDGLILVHEANRHKVGDGAYKFLALRDAGWDVARFHDIASTFSATDERYCMRCETVMDVAFGRELAAWRKCPKCGPSSAPIP